MPKILELRDIDGVLWARIGQLGEFESGSVVLYSPKEVNAIRRDELASILYYIAKRREELNAQPIQPSE